MVVRRELNRRANQLAHHLRNCGVGPDLVVPCFSSVPRSSDHAPGRHEGRGPYLPLVPGLPIRRLAAMIEASRAALLVTDSTLVSSLPQHQLPVVCLDRDAEQIARCDDRNPRPLAGPEHLVYVLFTSGSTGQTPKGVEIEHRALVNFPPLHAAGTGDDRS